MRITESFVRICKLKHKRKKGTRANKVIQGSKGAGKTYSILLRWILMADKSDEIQLCTIVTDSLPNLKTGAIRDFENICLSMAIIPTGTRTPYVYMINNWKFEFFGVDDEKKGRGGRRDRLFINEANRLNWKTARALISRTHVEFICDFNPVNEFWAHEMFVNTKNCGFLKLTYKQNGELPQAEVDDIECYAPDGKTPDENYWRVFGLGLTGFVEGMILKGWKEYDQLPTAEYQESIGIDFGWEDPLTAIKVFVDHKKKHVYWNEMFYGSHTKYENFIPLLKAHPLYNGDILFCDHEPRDIMTLRDGDLSAIEANKSAGLVSDVRLIKQYQLFIHKDSENLQREANAWKYQEKRGVIIDYPDQTCEDHALDAGRYGFTGIVRR